ncbi:hypothetical protein B0H10DRAFT_451813 [Mycena sp. CBHHK59/15]|nr:hypothetical protein B0H10DRAFT_451813 [Mycena sp. CBHHK59/15]
MGLANLALNFAVCLFLALLVCAQSNVVSPHSVSFVSNTISTTEPPVSVHSLSYVPASTTTTTDPDVSVNPLSFVPAPLTLSWSSTEIPVPTTTSGSSKSNKGAIAGKVIGGVAAAVIAAVGAFLLLRIRRKSNRHWRNRTTGRWQDPEGKQSAGPVYVGQPFDRPYDGYNHDIKVSVASPTTPNSAPLFIREPGRITRPFSGSELGHTRGASSHYRDDGATYTPT